MKRIDLTGKKFGYLTVEKYSHTTDNGRFESMWQCVCECGNHIVTSRESLVSGKKVSCGCKNGKWRITDLTGKRFGYLTVIKLVDRIATPNGRFHWMWLCKCDCGKEVIARADTLKRGGKLSCGCRKHEASIENGKRNGGSNKTHGMTFTRLYGVWNGIKNRTTNKNHNRYADYGGRGITLCEEWNDFSVFCEWAIAHGYDENAPFGKCTIDRIDNDKGYSPDNCRFVDMKEQSKNKRPRKKKGA